VTKTENISGTIEHSFCSDTSNAFCFLTQRW